MPWPQLTDYQEAVQDPRRAFNDPELRQGTPQLDRLGLPRPITGGFASVYQVTCTGRRYAVRCFNRYQPDIAMRYARIGQHLQRVQLPYMVVFEFQPRGILVRGEWYPIVKMEWLEGEPLHVYLERRLTDPAAIRDLAQQFVQLCADLQRASIAHGDLQHGNILVVGGRLRLIDYDGMYVPDLAGRPSHELGHRNYQHPRRTDRDFGPHLDHFAAWVIYASLMALSVEPALWRQVGGGDECLIFRREDFERPTEPAALTVLAAQRDSRAQALATALRSVLTISDLAQVPALDRWLAPPPQPKRSQSVPLPSWVREHLSAPTPTRAVAGGTAAPPAWVQGHRAMTVPIQIGTTVWWERGLLLSALLVLVGLTAAAATGRLAVTTVAAATGGEVMAVLSALAWCYHRRDEVGRKIWLLRKERGLRRGIRSDEKRIARGLARKDELDRAEAAALARLEARLHVVSQEEQAALAKMSQQLGATMTRLNQERQAQRQAEVAEVSRRLRRLQEQYLWHELAGHAVIAARIDGIGVGTKARLLAAGIFTAADIVQVSYQPGNGAVELVVPGGQRVQVDGIGPARAAALATWRHRLEAACRVALPATLPVAQEAVIRASYRSRRQRLDRQAAAATSAAQERSDRLRQRYSRRQAHLASEIQAVRARYGQQQARLAKDNAGLRDHLAERQLHLAVLQHELAAYTRVTVRAYVRRLLFVSGE